MPEETTIKKEPEDAENKAEEEDKNSGLTSIHDQEILFPFLFLTDPREEETGD